MVEHTDSIYLFIYLSTYMPIYVSFHLYNCPSIYLAIYLSFMTNV